MLIIEIDGSSQISKNEEDYIRQRYLENLGYKVIRFAESKVIYRIDNVVAGIDYAIRCLGNELEKSPLIIRTIYYLYFIKNLQ